MAKNRSPQKHKNLKKTDSLKISQKLNMDYSFLKANSALPNFAHKQAGFNMVEVMLVLAAGAAITATAYGAYKVASASSKIEKTEGQIKELTENILNSQAGASDFSALNTRALIDDNLVPKGMKVGTDEIYSEWGQPIRVVPTDVVRDGNTISNAGFAVIFDRVDSANCSKLASSTGGIFTNIRINGEDVGIGRNLDVASAVDLCKTPAVTMQFIYEAAAEIAASGSISLCEEIKPTDPEIQHLGCAAGYFGIITQQRSAFCTGPYDPYQWTAWSTTSDTCATCPAPENRVNSQNLTCPTGQLGMWVQTRNETRDANCPVAGPTGPTENWNWKTWQPTSPWTDSINTCAPICVLPTPNTEKKFVAENYACPSGQYGHNNWQREDGRVASCPAPTGNYTWSAWTPTGVTKDLDNTCATCPAAENKTESCPSGSVGEIKSNRTFKCSGEGGWNPWTVTSNTCVTCPAPQSQTLDCPSGSYGTIVQSRSYNCQGATGGWNGWTVTTNTCQTCPAPITETQKQNVDYTTNNCPAGSYGNSTYKKEQSRARVGNYICPAGTTNLPPVNYRAWDAWEDTSTPHTLLATTCQNCPAPSNEDKTQWVAYTANLCPVGSYGNTNREKEQKASRTITYVCPAGTPTLPASTASGWSAWTDTGNTRHVSNVCTTCPAPATNTAYQWIAASAVCPSGQYGTNNWEKEQTRNQSVTYVCPAGTTVLPAPVYGAWSVWTDTAKTRSQVNTCQNCPSPYVEDRTQWVAYTANLCPTGSYGNTNREKEQKSSRTMTFVCPAGTTTLPAPSVGTWGAWSDTGTTRVKDNGTCATCPAASTENRTRWNAYTAFMCPAGQYGYTNREIEQSSDRSVTYVCPAGTTVLPAPTYGGWSPWENTANTRHVSNVCSTCPTPTTATEYQWVAFTGYQCPSGQYGYSNMEQEQTRSRSVTYTCPANTSTLPAPTYGGWSVWANTVNTRTLSNACNNCPAAGTETATQWVGYTAALCPAGQYGLTNREKEQSRNRSFSYTCPAGTTAIPAPTYAGWSVWTDTGTTRAVNNGTCATCPAASTGFDYQWVPYSSASCPVGQYGLTNRQKQQYRTRSVTYTCPANTATLPAPSYGGWGGWIDNPGTDQAVNNGTCANCPAASTGFDYQWVPYTSASCPAGQYGLTNRQKQQYRTRSVTYTCPAGTTAIPAPSYGGWGGWIDNPGTDQAVNNGTCANCPAGGTNRETSWAQVNLNRCPAGAYGYHVINRESARTRNYSYTCPAGTTAIPAPTYGGWSGWALTGSETYLGGDCPSCPGPSNQPNYQWVAASAACPAGQTGSNTWQKQQVQYRSVSYNCPYGTASIPAATYGGWGGWADTGAIQGQSNTCTPSCTPSSTYEYNYSYSTCPSGQRLVPGGQGEARRLKTVSCPGSVVTYGAWQVTNYPQCCPNGQQCQLN